MIINPNPFKATTNIAFYLPNSGKIELKIMDIQGRILQQITQIYEAGFHELLINQRDLGTSGILYYQLTDGNVVATKKMILLK